MQTANRGFHNTGIQNKAGYGLTLLDILKVKPSSYDPFFGNAAPLLDNKLGITNREQLHKYEDAITPLTIQIALKRLAHQERFGLKQLQMAHSIIFGPIYPWAGTIRKSNIAKQSEFTPPELISKRVTAGFDRFYRQHAPDGNLAVMQNMPIPQVAEAFAKLYSDLNTAHMAREGNGRSMRTVLTVMARRGGHDLDWPRISDAKQEWDRASERAKTGQGIDQLVNLFQRVTVKLDYSAPEQLSAITPTKADVKLAKRQIRNLTT